MTRRPIIFGLFLPALFLLAAGPARGQAGGERRGTITYVSGDVYYISLGSPSGIEDSSIVSVVDGADTIATLQVFAVSSKSSACRILSSGRAPKRGEAVVARVAGPPPTQRDAGTGLSVGGNGAGAGEGPDQGGAIRGGTARGGTARGDTDRNGGTGRESRPFPLAVRGRISAQYQTFDPGNSTSAVTQPSLSVNLRGALRDAPLRFEISGVARASRTGSAGPFGAGGVNRSRVYRLSVEYDDSLNRFGAGRLLPSAGVHTGYLDGLVAARKIGIVEVGVAAGFEPEYRREGIVSDRRKAVVFVGASSAAPDGWSAAAAYAKTFLRSSAERSVLSGAATFAPSRGLFVTARSEVDFLAARNSAVLHKPRLSSLLAQVRYRISDAVSAGAGVTAWRPVYPLSFDLALPDSLRDDRLWVSPSLSLRVNAGAGVSVQEQYSPRSTPEGFGREYSNVASVGMEDILGSGVAARVTQSLNHSSVAVSTGYAIAARRSVGDAVDAGVRYQTYRNDFGRNAEIGRSGTFGVDVGAALPNSLYLMLGAEISSGSGPGQRLFSGSLSWRF